MKTRARVKTVIIACTAALSLAVAGAVAPVTRNANAVITPASGGNHALIAQYGPYKLATWTQASRYGGDSCDAANGATVHVSGNGAYLDLTTTGKPGSCAVIASPGKFSTASGVIEARVFEPPYPTWGQFADWPAVWMRGDDWPVNGELDALEGLTGYDYSTYWYQGAGGQPENASTCTDQCGESVDVYPESAPAKPGWTTVDMVFSQGAAQVWYNGELFATFSGQYVTSQPMQLVLNLTSGQYGGAAVPATGYVQWVRVFS